MTKVRVTKSMIEQIVKEEVDSILQQAEDLNPTAAIAAATKIQTPTPSTTEPDPSSEEELKADVGSMKMFFIEMSKRMSEGGITAQERGLVKDVVQKMVDLAGSNNSLLSGNVGNKLQRAIEAMNEELESAIS